MSDLTKVVCEKSLSPTKERMVHLTTIAVEIAKLYHPQRSLDKEFFEANRYEVTDAEMPIVVQLVRDEHGIDSDEFEEIPDMENLQIEAQAAQEDIQIVQEKPTPTKRKRTVHTTPLSSPVIRTKNTARAEAGPARKRSLVENGTYFKVKVDQPVS